MIRAEPSSGGEPGPWCSVLGRSHQNFRLCGLARQFSPILNHLQRACERLPSLRMGLEWKPTLRAMRREHFRFVFSRTWDAPPFLRRLLAFMLLALFSCRSVLADAGVFPAPWLPGSRPTRRERVYPCLSLGAPKKWCFPWFLAPLSLPHDCCAAAPVWRVPGTHMHMGGTRSRFHLTPPPWDVRSLLRLHGFSSLSDPSSSN